MFLICSFVLTIVAAFVPLAENSITENQTLKKELAFGNPSSNIETFIFTDWLCPFCQRLEPDLEKMLPILFQQTRTIFVDLPNHPGGELYSFYNYSFMINNKSKYTELRHALNDLAKTTKSPTNEQLATALAPLKIEYKPLEKQKASQIAMYYDTLATEFKLKLFPTIVFRNVKSKKEVKLEGLKAITEESVVKAIDSLRN